MKLAPRQLGLVGAAIAAGLALFAPRRAAAAATGGDSYQPTFEPGPSEPEPAAADGIDQAQRNLQAFLFMIRTAEGTADENGYRALFGHTARNPRLFDSFEDHPRIASSFKDKAGRRLWTSAAGAYQFMAASPIPGGGYTRVDTWSETKRKLNLADFSPESQDLAAVELIRQAGALGDVRAGRFELAVGKVCGRWASLPGAGYDQQERTIAAVSAAYRQAGGAFA